MEKVLEHERSLLTTALNSSSSLPDGVGVAEVERSGINLQTIRDQVRCEVVTTIIRCIDKFQKFAKFRFR